MGNSLLPTHLYLLTRLFAVSYLSLENLIPNHWLTTMKAPIVLLTKHALNKQPFHRSYLQIEGAKKFTLDKKKYEKIKGDEQCTREKQVSSAFISNNDLFTLLYILCSSMDEFIYAELLSNFIIIKLILHLLIN